jgi:hypothetical protein
VRGHDRAAPGGRAKNGVRLVSITQDLGDDTMSSMIRQIMALFDEQRPDAAHLHLLPRGLRQGDDAADREGWALYSCARSSPLQAQKTAGFGVPSSVPKWRAGEESNLPTHRDGFFQISRFCISATCLSITSRL